MRRVEPSTASYPSAEAGSSALGNAQTPGHLFLQAAWPRRLAPRSPASLASSTAQAVSRSPTTTGPCTRLPAMVGPTRQTDRAYLVSVESGLWPRRDFSHKHHTNSGGQSNETSAHDSVVASRPRGLRQRDSRLRERRGSELIISGGDHFRPGQ